MDNEIIRKAEDFINNEQQYHLGFLPIEGSHPETAHLDRDFAESTVKGIRSLLKVDHGLIALAERELAGERFTQLTNAMCRALDAGQKIVFSGCGATGRLSILLEAAYREFFVRHPEKADARPELADRVFSIMTGGDYALIRSVEFFEDYQEFGRRQARDLRIGVGDVLVAITGTGETSSILGTVMEAAEQGALVFLIIGVSREIPESRLERSRLAFNHPQVTVIDMPCGAMAIAGSTRMQSTTLEMLISGAALEIALARHCGGQPRQPRSYAGDFVRLLAALGSEENLRVMAGYIEFEEKIYRANGLITYFADEFLLDVLTDTTERSPTFSLPPFRKITERQLPQSWAFAKNPRVATRDAWRRCLGREMRCLEWNRNDYLSMNTEPLIANGMPAISADELGKFTIGFEGEPYRENAEISAAVMIGYADNLPMVEFEKAARAYSKRTILSIGDNAAAGGFAVRWQAADSPLQLMRHLAIKLLLNIISTATMVRMGRVTGNWMTYLDVSNKKLFDRGIRIIADQCGLDYRGAAIELFGTLEELKSFPPEKERPSPIHHTIERLSKRK